MIGFESITTWFKLPVKSKTNNFGGHIIVKIANSIHISLHPSVVLLVFLWTLVEETRMAYS